MDPSKKRKSVIRSMIPTAAKALLDVGCGPVTKHYPYFGAADRIVAMDWNAALHCTAPDGFNLIDADFLSHDFGQQTFDVIICADVFEHVSLEQEQAFTTKLRDLLTPGGTLIISVPHAGTFAFLDPYGVKPAMQRVLRAFGLYRKTHNGTCDIRKGHKHYRPEELAEVFPELSQTNLERYGYFYEPLAAWAMSFENRGVPIPFRSRLAKGLDSESTKDFGPKAYSMAMSFMAPES